jgi:lantibiotic modifying enzyme
VLVPSWFEGSAGVVGVYLRYWLVTKKPLWNQLLNQMLPDLYRKFMPFPDYFVGLAGLGDVLLDAYQWTGEKRYLNEAARAASGILPFAINQPEGLAFPGEQLWRISTDFATGSAGIIYFLNRLSSALKGVKTDSILHLDGILKSFLETESKVH